MIAFLVSAAAATFTGLTYKTNAKGYRLNERRNRQEAERRAEHQLGQTAPVAIEVIFLNVWHVIITNGGEASVHDVVLETLMCPARPDVQPKGGSSTPSHSFTVSTRLSAETKR
jgi:hypothetical protein